MEPFVVLQPTCAGLDLPEWQHRLNTDACICDHIRQTLRCNARLHQLLGWL